MALFIRVGAQDRNYTFEAGSVTWNNSTSDKNTATATLQEIGPSYYTPKIGERVEIGDVSLGLVYFVGTVDRVVSELHGNYDGRVMLHKLTMVGYDAIPYKRTFQYLLQYRDMQAGAIFKDITENWLGGEGINTDDVLDGPNIASIEFYPGHTDSYVGNCFDKILEVIQSDSEKWYWDIQGTFNQPRLRLYKDTTYVSGFTIEADEPNVIFDSVTVTSDRKDLVNRVFVSIPGGTGDPRTDVLHGNGAARSFTLPKTIANEPVIKVNGEIKTVAVRDTGVTANWYYAPQSSIIEQDAGETILTVTDDLEVYYFPIDTTVVLAAYDATSIASMAAVENMSGHYDIVLQGKEGMTVSQANELAQSYLAVRKNESRELEFKMIMAGQTLNPGQFLLLDTTLKTTFGINDDTMVIQSIDRSNEGGDCYVNSTVKATNRPTSTSLAGLLDTVAGTVGIGGGASSVPPGEPLDWIADGAITTVKLGDDVITTDKIADGACTSDKIGSLDASRINNDSNVSGSNVMVALNTLLGSFITQAQLDAALAGYTTTSAMNALLALKTNLSSFANHTHIVGDGNTDSSGEHDHGGEVSIDGAHAHPIDVTQPPNYS